MAPADTATDPRPVWNPETALPAVENMFETAAREIASTDPALLPHVLSPLVDTFHSQVQRLREDTEHLRGRLAATPTDPERSAIEAEITLTDAKLSAFDQLLDTAKTEYQRHTRHAWTPQDDPAPIASPAEPPDPERSAPEAGAAADATEPHPAPTDTPQSPPAENPHIDYDRPNPFPPDPDRPGGEPAKAGDTPPSATPQ